MAYLIALYWYKEGNHRRYEVRLNKGLIPAIDWMPRTGRGRKLVISRPDVHELVEEGGDTYAFRYAER